MSRQSKVAAKMRATAADLNAKAPGLDTKESRELAREVAKHLNQCADDTTRTGKAGTR